MSTRAEREAEWRDEARGRAHCLGCALGLNHNRCDWEDDDDDTD